MKFKERLSPIYMVGDSHCLIFNNLSFEAQLKGKDFHFIAQSKYCPGIAANNFIDTQGNLNPHLMRALLSECLIDSSNKALYQFQSHLSSIITLLAGRTVASPVLVFFCGGSDIVNIFLKYLTTQYDFYLPNQEELLKAFKPIKAPQTYPYETAREFAEKLLNPFFQGLLKLKSMGFNQFYVHSIQPFAVDEQEFTSMYLYRCPAYVRYKALLLFNQMLKEKCLQHNIGFLDIWDQVTENNQLKPEYYLDTIHLNKEAAFLTMEALWKQMTKHVEQSYLPQNYLGDLYEKLIELTVHIFAQNYKSKEVLDYFQVHKDILDKTLIHQTDLQGKIPFIVSCLYYIAGAFYGSKDTEGLKHFISSYLPLFQEYKPDIPSPEKKDEGLIYTEGSPSDLNLDFGTYWLIGDSPQNTHWQEKYPQTQFKVLPQESLEEVKHLALCVKELYIPSTLPNETQDLVIFALIENQKISIYKS